MAKFKSDDEWFRESLGYHFDIGKKLAKICPECTNEYNDHSLFKLIGFTYWVGLFLPIVHKNFRETHNYRVCYIDIMAGSGVTSTQRAGDYFCGSCPGVLMSQSAQKYPFDLAIAIELDPERAKALENRLESLNLPTKLTIIPKDINEVIPEIIQEINKQNSISYTIIDPEGYKGLYWSTVEPFLKIKGDLMINWFEDDLWRIKGAALSDKTNVKIRDSHHERLGELFGSEGWKTASTPTGLTDLFKERLISSNDNLIIEEVVIPRSAGNFKLLLLTSAVKQAKEWRKQVTRRINSIHGKEISKLLDAKAGRLPTLHEFL